MFTYGFYNSLNGDRKYDAVQMSSIFDGVIEDGVYANVGEFFAVIAGTGMSVIVKTGRAWFDHTWSLLDAHLPLEIEESDFLQTRIDAIVLEVDSRIEKRENNIKVVKGVPSVNPVKPTLIHEQGVYQHALAYVTVSPGTVSITADKIEIVVGTDETPFVQCPLKTVSISDLFNQWDAEFTAWFDNVKLQLTENVVTNLQYQIDNKVSKADKATAEDVTNGTPNKWVDAASLSSLIPRVGDIVAADDPDVVLHPNHYIKMDGTPCSASLIPEPLRSKCKNMLPFPEPVTALIGSSENVGSYGHPICFTNLSIGDYDYIVQKTNQCYIHKLDRRTNTVVKSALLSSLGTTSLWCGICGQHIVVLRKSLFSGIVYDSDLNQVRTFSFADSFANFTCKCIAQINNNRIVLVGFLDYNAYQNQPAVYYTDNLFVTITVASFASLPADRSKLIPMLQNNSTRKIPRKFGDPTANLYMASNGRLFILQEVFYNNTFQLASDAYYYPLYYSDDYGTTWNHINLSSSFNAGIFGYNQSTFNQLWMVGVNDTIYVCGITLKKASTEYVLGVLPVNALTLTFGNLSKSLSTDGNGYVFAGLSSIYDVAAVKSSKSFMLMAENSGAMAITFYKNNREYTYQDYSYYVLYPFINLDTLKLQEISCENDNLSVSTRSVSTQAKPTICLDDYIFYFHHRHYGKLNGRLNRYYYDSSNLPVMSILNLSGDITTTIGEINIPYLDEYLPATATVYLSFILADDRLYLIPSSANTESSGSFRIGYYTYFYIDRTKLLLPPTGEYIKIE